MWVFIGHVSRSFDKHDIYDFLSRFGQFVGQIIIFHSRYFAFAEIIGTPHFGKWPYLHSFFRICPYKGIYPPSSMNQPEPPHSQNNEPSLTSPAQSDVVQLQNTQNVRSEDDNLSELNNSAIIDEISRYMQDLSSGLSSNLWEIIESVSQIEDMLLNGHSQTYRYVQSHFEEVTGFLENLIDIRDTLRVFMQEHFLA